MLSGAALRELKKLYLEEFGEEISDEKALELGTSLLNLFDHIYRPVKKDWLGSVSDSEKQSKN